MDARDEIDRKGRAPFGCQGQKMNKKAKILLICIGIAIAIVVAVLLLTGVLGGGITLKAGEIADVDFDNPPSRPGGTPDREFVGGDEDANDDEFVGGDGEAGEGENAGWGGADYSDLPGMPEGYKLSREQLELKEAMAADNGSLASYPAMSPGVDYAEGEFVFFAGDDEEAWLIAEAYDAELIQFAGGIALARQKPGSKYSLGDLLAAAADMDNNMPAIELNLRYKAF